jgi:hypothetical protein
MERINQTLKNSLAILAPRKMLGQPTQHLNPFAMIERRRILNDIAHAVRLLELRFEKIQPHPLK